MTNLTIAGEPAPRSTNGSGIIDNTTPVVYSLNGVTVSSAIYNQFVSSPASMQTNSASFATWFNSLSTTLPSRPGVFWNNGNVLARS